ncbi:hypothetical protein [Tissierella sp.]|uniref:hypothetical protein n=1 Tax=Tissierella sp. TaxID=41274 RepID=UPI003026ECFA
MKNRKIILLLIITILLIGCSEKKEPIKLIEVSGEGSTIYENDNIKIKIADNVNEKETIYTSILNELQKIDEFSPIENIEIQISKQYIVPNIDKIIKCDAKFIETEEFKKELIKKSYGIYDNWISEGLYAKIYNTEKSQIDFATYYSDNEFSLFGARFFEPFASKEEIESVKSASIDLVEYLLENNKKMELVKNNIELSDIEAWAKEKDIDLSYQREIESLMNRMEVYDIADKLIINTREEINGFKIDISIADIKTGHEKTEQYDTSKKIEQIILRFDRDILAIKKGIENDAPRFYAEYKEVLNNVPKIKYIFEMPSEPFRGGGYVMKGTDEIYLININTQVHEYCHFLFHNPFIKKDIVVNKPSGLDEGIANYLYVVYSETYGKWIERTFYVIENPMERNGVENATSDILIAVEKLSEKQLNIYTENNISANNVEEILKSKNKRILASHVEYSFTIKISETITGDKLSRGIAPLDLMNEGDSMDYVVNFSFIPYLIEEYGLEKILYLNVASFDGLTYKEVFGKTFDELKVDWMDYLKETIKGIESIL